LLGFLPGIYYSTFFVSDELCESERIIVEVQKSNKDSVGASGSSADPDPKIPEAEIESPEFSIQEVVVEKSADNDTPEQNGIRNLCET
jgi:hypothetical protein